MFHGAVKLTPPTALARASQHAPVGETQLAALKITEERDIRRAPVRVNVRETAEIPVDRDMSNGGTQHGAHRSKECGAMGRVVAERGRREPDLGEVAVPGRLRRGNVRAGVRKVLRDGTCQPLDDSHLVGLGTPGPQWGEDAQPGPQGDGPQP